MKVITDADGNTIKTLRGGVIPHRLTAEDRRKGIEKRRQKAREAEAQALADLYPKGLKVLGRILDDGLKAAKPDANHRAAAERVVDHMEGRPMQRTAALVLDTSDLAQLGLEDALRILGRDPASLHTTRTPSDRSVSEVVEGEAVEVSE